MVDTPLHVVVVGAGGAGLETALALLDAIAREYVTVELVAPEREFTYRPLAVAEPFQVGEVRRFPLDRLIDAAGAMGSNLGSNSPSRCLDKQQSPAVSRAFLAPRVGLEPTTLRLTAGCSAN
jgi:hypothetical protein